MILSVCLLADGGERRGRVCQMKVNQGEIRSAVHPASAGGRDVSHTEIACPLLARARLFVCASVSGRMHFLCPCCSESVGGSLSE